MFRHDKSLLGKIAEIRTSLVDVRISIEIEEWCDEDQMGLLRSRRCDQVPKRSNGPYGSNSDVDWSFADVIPYISHQLS